MGAAETKNPSDEGPSLLSEENFSFIDVENEESTTCGDAGLRIVLLGKTGVGKSSAGNAILGCDIFDGKCSAASQTKDCTKQEGMVCGRKVTLIDTPGIFDTSRSDEDLRSELVTSQTECAPGPHAFLLVLKVERHTKESKVTVKKIREQFGKDVFKHTVILFTHGDELDEGMTIKDFVAQEEANAGCPKNKKADDQSSLKALVQECGERVHVIDSKRWKTEHTNFCERPDLLQQMMQLMTGADEASVEQVNKLANLIPSKSEDDVHTKSNRRYRSNNFQISELMTTIDAMVQENKGFYTNPTLETLAKAIEIEVKTIQAELGEAAEKEDMSSIKCRARERVRNKALRVLSGVSVGMLLGAFFGVAVGATIPVILVAGLLTGVASKAGMELMKSVRNGTPLASAAVMGVGLTHKDIKMAINLGRTITKDLAHMVPTVSRVGTGTAIGIVGAEAGASTVSLTAETGAVVGARLGTGAIAGIGVGVTVGILATTGAIRGGISGGKAAKRSDDPDEAAKNAAKAVIEDSGNTISQVWNFTQRPFQLQTHQQKQY